LPQQAEPDDSDNVTQFNVGDPDAMQSNGADSSGSSLVEADFRAHGKLCQQQSRDTGEFGMDGVARSRTRDSIAGLNVCDSFADGHDLSCAAVSRSAWLIHTAAYRYHRGCHAISSYFVPDLAHKVGTHSRLLHEIFPSEFRRSPFRADRDQGRCCSHQNATRKQFGSRDIDYFDLAAADLLENLFHKAKKL
jgi:hypothetical protein